MTTDIVLEPNSHLIDNCDGESDVMLLCCEVHDVKNNLNHTVMLYEVCKQVFNLYESIFSDAHKGHPLWKTIE